MFLFVTWRVMPGFLRRHPGIHLLLLGFGCLIAIGLFLDAAGAHFYDPNAPVSVSPPKPRYPKLTDGAHWYVPSAMTWMTPNPRYVWIPPTMTSADPTFCIYMDGAYYRQPTEAQQADWTANCPQS